MSHIPIINTKEGHNEISSRLYLISYIFLFILGGVVVSNFFIRERIIKSNINNDNDNNLEKEIIKILNLLEYIIIVISFSLFLSFYVYTIGTEHEEKIKRFVKVFGIGIIILYCVIYIARILVSFYSYTNVYITSILILFYTVMVLVLFIAMIIKFIRVSIHHRRIDREGNKEVMKVVQSINNQKYP